MTQEETILESGLRYLRSRTDFVPKIVLVLGSGLNGFADLIAPELEIPYQEVPGIPVSTVPGHAGKFLFGHLDGIPVALMQGRLHYYEGYTPQEVVRPLRLLRKMGAEIFFLTNAAGGMKKGICPGDFLLIKDHISFLIPSPLRGENPETLGPRFPDMSEVYSSELREKLLAAARAAGIELKEGIYAQTPGPAFETPAEIRMLKACGADAVGMSSAIEAMAAKHCGMKVCGISCISNLASGLAPVPLSLEEVYAVSAAAAPKLRKLLAAGIRAVGR